MLGQAIGPVERADRIAADDQQDGSYRRFPAFSACIVADAKPRISDFSLASALGSANKAVTMGANLFVPMTIKAPVEVSFPASCAAEATIGNSLPVRRVDVSPHFFGGQLLGRRSTGGEDDARRWRGRRGRKSFGSGKSNQ